MNSVPSMSSELQREENFLKFVISTIKRIKAQFDPKLATAANPADAEALLAHFEVRRNEIEWLNESDPYFGRIDKADGSLRVYIGPQKISSDRSSRLPDGVKEVLDSTENILVISPMAREAAPFYTATEVNPQGLSRRRYYDISDGKLFSFTENRFGSTEEIEEVWIDNPRLRRALDAPRGEYMNAITATITKTQYEVIDMPPQVWLSIQGGPGTGKSVVAMHRLATISFRLRQDRLAQVPNLSTDVVGDGSTGAGTGLVFVAPSSSFLDYVRRLIPDQLGERAVQYRDLDSFLGHKATAKRDSKKLAHLKGNCEVMVPLLRQAVMLQIGTPIEVVFRYKGFKTSLSSGEINALIASLINQNVPYQRMRESFFNVCRTQISSALSEQITRDIQRTQEERLERHKATGAPVGFEAKAMHEEERKLREAINSLAEFMLNDKKLDEDLNLIMPSLTSSRLLETLKSSRSAFREAIFSAKALDQAPETKSDIAELEESINTWFGAVQTNRISPDDVPLLAELDALIFEEPPGWFHVAVDEAQDLSPMALRAISRRVLKSGGLTLIGDLAQSTGPWLYQSWGDVWNYCLNTADREFQHRELPVSFRIPADIIDYAEPFRRLAGVRTMPVSSVKTDQKGFLAFSSTEKDWESELVEAIQTLISKQPKKSLNAAIITEDIKVRSLMERMNKLSAVISVRSMSVESAKGFEFDLVVAINPEVLMGTSRDDYDFSLGNRRLWVAATRSTKFMVVADIWKHGASKKLD